MARMRILTLLALTTLTACDCIDRGEYRREREDRDYQAAMDDYRAGRLAQAVRGLKKVCAGNPANSSARFQLACLLQDFEKDNLAALCAYNEFLQQRPNGEKEALARSRLAACEKLLAGELAAKYGLDNEQAAATRIRELEQRLASSEKQGDAAAKDLEAANRRIAALERETERLRNAVKGDDDTGRKSDVSEALALMAEDDAEAEKGAPLVLTDRELLDDDESSEAAPVKPEADAKARRVVGTKSDPAAAQKKESARDARPDSYVVQEGDTLYKIAMKFYGRKSAWSAIRDANKAIISNDGRVNAGQRIVLPK